MERVLSTEDKIKRAEEIYNNRRKGYRCQEIAKVNINGKKNLKLFKKTIKQIFICFIIYSTFYLIKNNNYIFSEDFINQVNEILSYDINFKEMYFNTIDKLKIEEIPKENDNEEINEEKGMENITNNEQSGIGGTNETNDEDIQKNAQEEQEISQMEKDAIDIKEKENFINPIEGTVTSKFGWRNPTTKTVPKYHTGIDIANKSGTIIRSATKGTVVLVSSEGDYRKSFKNTK